MKTTLFILSSLLVVSGCNWDEAAVLGRDPLQALYSGEARTCPAAYELIKESEFGIKDCAAPSELAAVVADGKGLIHIWVPKLSDGQFPEVANLVYSSSFSDFILTFTCLSGQESADGKLVEINCTPNASLRLSPVELTSQDYRLMVDTVVLKNPACGKTVNLKRTTYRGSCTYYSRHDDYYSVLFGELNFPPLWIESSAK